jgi:hypothetical protein
LSEEITQTTILKEADELIHGDRANAYGSALENAEAWAVLFSTITGVQVKPEHYPISQICVKLARERSKHHKDNDNWRDIAGYVGVWDKIKKELDERLKKVKRGMPS